MIKTLTDAQAHQKRHGFLSETCGDSITANEKAVISRSKGFRLAKQPNKTENEFGRILEARRAKGEFIEPIRFEAVKLRVAGNCYYTPDWMAVKNPAASGPVIVFFEVKGGHIWDDSKVKFKAAQELHQWASFEMWQKKAGEWRRIG